MEEQLVYLIAPVATQLVLMAIIISRHHKDVGNNLAFWKQIRTRLALAFDIFATMNTAYWCLMVVGPNWLPYKVEFDFVDIEVLRWLVGILLGAICLLASRRHLGHEFSFHEEIHWLIVFLGMHAVGYLCFAVVTTHFLF